jgi:solute carrier family 35 protein E1
MGSKTAALHRTNDHTDRPLWVTLLLLLVWIFSSVSSTLTNKTLMTLFPYSFTLTLIHLLASVIVDIAIIGYRGISIFPINKQLLYMVLPSAMSINCSKTLTYISYGYVPASLTHTAKASSPIFSVILTKILYNKQPNIYVTLSLIPITLGVTLSAATELNFVFFGFISAVAASIAAVLNTIYGKQALHHVSCTDPIIFHFYS